MKLMNGFKPYYKVSSGENAGTGFATFKNSVPQSVLRNYAPAPVISHYRVTPLGFGRDRTTNQRYGVIRLDFLTEWNRDDGPAIGADCLALSAGLGLSLDELGAHALDNERSAILVAAPDAGYYQYNVDHRVYKAYDFYLAAHEGIFPFDHSDYYAPDNPWAIGNHPVLYLSKSKHATYGFNPHRFPMVNNAIIAETYFLIRQLYVTGQISLT